MTPNLGQHISINLLTGGKMVRLCEDIASQAETDVQHPSMLPCCYVFWWRLMKKCNTPETSVTHQRPDSAGTFFIARPHLPLCSVVLLYRPSFYCHYSPHGLQYQQEGSYNTSALSKSRQWGCAFYLWVHFVVCWLAIRIQRQTWMM